MSMIYDAYNLVEGKTYKFMIRHDSEKILMIIFHIIILKLFKVVNIMGIISTFGYF